MNFRFQMLKYLIVNKQKNIVKILAFVEKCFYLHLSPFGLILLNTSRLSG